MDVHNLRERLNQLDRQQVVELLESIDLACYDKEDTDELRDVLEDSIESGEIFDPTT